MCGGSDAERRQMVIEAGLSPRVRGKQWTRTPVINIQRSIPACAGEASRNLPAHRKREVYPRVCGGSNSQDVALDGIDGLSPRVRGKPTSAQNEPQ